MTICSAEGQSPPHVQDRIVECLVPAGDHVCLQGVAMPPSAILIHDFAALAL
jgi:hypothetical protein